MQNLRISKERVGRRTLLESPSLLCVVWRTLDLRFSKQRAQGGRKFLSGARPGSDGTKEGVLRDMVRAFIEAGYVDVPTKEHLERVRGEILHSLTHAIEHWDRFVGIRRGCERPVGEADVVRYLRLGTIDIALRVAAFDLTFGWPVPPAFVTPPIAEAPAWARDGGMRAWLCDLPGALGLTRDEMHKGKSKDDWSYRKTRPSIENLTLLASSLAKHERGDNAVARCRTYLAWGFALEALCDELALTIGNREVVEELAAMFSRLRRLVWQLGVRTDPVRRATVFEPILRRGSQCDEARALIDAITRPDGLAALNGGELDERAEMLGSALRACQGDWLAGDVFPGVHSPPPPPELPEELQQNLVAAMLAGSEAFAEIALSHPASSVWGLRLCVQRGILNGSLTQIAPVLALVADTVGGAALQLEAAMIFLLAGNLDEVRQRLPQLDEPTARQLCAVLDVLDGRASDAIPSLRAVAAEDSSWSFLLAIALASSNQPAEALRIVRELLDTEPGYAAALALAARCAWAVGETRAGNAYAKRATLLGQPVERGPRKPRKKP